MSESTVHHERRGRVAINGQAVREARRARGWKPSRVAAELGVCEKTLARYETGVTEPLWRDVAVLAELLELAPADLFVCCPGGERGQTA